MIHFHKLWMLPGGGTLEMFGLGCATGTAEPLGYTRPSLAEFFYPAKLD